MMERRNNAVHLQVVFRTVDALLELEEADGELNIAAVWHDYHPETVAGRRIPVWE